MRIAGIASKRGMAWLALLMTITGAVTLGFLDGLSKNWADIEVGSDDPSLRPILRPEPPDRAVQVAAEMIDRLPRWKVEAADPEAGTLHATHRTLLWRFVDDIHLTFEPTSEGCRITGHSQSRIGKGDLGQNARNLRELAQSLRIPGAEQVSSR